MASALAIAAAALAITACQPEEVVAPTDGTTQGQGTAQPTQAPTADAPVAAPTSAPTSSPTETLDEKNAGPDEGAPYDPADPDATHYTKFKSPSGNINCMYEQGQAGSAWMSCQIGDKSYPRPANARDCGGGGAGDNAIRLVQGKGSNWLCAGDYWGDGASTLAYGEHNVTGSFRCSSTAAGIECRDLDTSHGFRLSKGSYAMF